MGYTDGKIVQNINNFSPVSEIPKITTSSYKSKIFINWNREKIVNFLFWIVQREMKIILMANKTKSLKSQLVLE